MHLSYIPQYTIHNRNVHISVLMMTSSNANIFRVTGHLCGEFTDPQWIPHTKASDAELWCFLFDLRPNKLSNKQSWGWWSQTPSRPLWRHRNVAFVEIRAVHTMEIQSICMLTLKIEIDPSHIENTHMTAVYPFHRLVEVADAMKID